MMKIGFIPSHRVPFNRQWAIDMRDRTIKSIKEKVKEIELIYPTETLTDGGLVETYEDAQKTIRLFKENNIEGLLIGMMTFGEEMPNLIISESFDKIPIQIFGTKESPFTDDGNRKSDSFCGTISTASGLIRRKIKFDFSGLYFPEEDNFISNLKKFASVCLTYNKFIGARIGILGTRPAPFETCAINEVNLIEKFRQKVIPYTMLRFYRDIQENKEIEKMNVAVNEIKEQYNCSLIDEDTINKFAKLECVLRSYAIEDNLDGFGIQCWTAMQEEISISPCMVMGRLTDSGIMSACEVDVHGALTMLIQYLLSFKKSVPHFIDWTIQKQDDENNFLAWHCGNAPVSLKHPSCQPLLNSHSILGEMLGQNKSFGTAEFQLKEGIVTISRLVEVDNKFKILIATGETVYDERNLRGSWKWIKVNSLKKLYRTIIEEGFTHHASMIYGDLSDEIIKFSKFAGIETIVI